ncbi:metallothionein [Pistricoccus aurantiacus]|uniref:Metallothionein n=1 Tax=Pistricoccus aurantiacus TaxID=1883414 RepID=A0A5B8SSP8_9GAMM|nr:metallothionein [Pistricoccus aurantiacus]QEA38113.1 metallothionein [Pistricoccus aurantiacus]
MADKETCACPKCDCEVNQDQAVTAGGKTYCCDACASGHENGEKCQHEGCNCDA